MAKLLFLTVFSVTFVLSMAGQHCGYSYGDPTEKSTVLLNETIQIPPGTDYWHVNFPPLAGSRTTFVCVDIKGLDKPGGPKVEYLNDGHESVQFYFEKPTDGWSLAHLLVKHTGFY